MTVSFAGRQEPDVESPDIAARHPLTVPQRRVWFRYLCEPESAAHNFRAVYELPGTVDLVRLRTAFDELTIRHDVLRSTFAESVNGEPYRVVDGTGPRWDAFDLAELSPGAAARRVEVLLQRDDVASFDLRTDVPLRITAIHRDGCDAILSLTAHSIAFDADSLSVMVEEVSALYADPSAELPVIAAQTIDDSSELADITFWRNQFDRRPDPVDLAGDSRTGATGEASQTRAGADDLIAEGRRYATAGGVSLRAVLLSAYAALVQRYTGASDFAIALGSSTRDSATVNVIGCYANAMLFRARVDRGESFAELVGRVDSALSAADKHNRAGIDDVVRALNPVRSRDRDGMEEVVRIGFAIQDRAGTLTLDGERARLRHAGPTSIGIPVQLSVNVGVDDATFMLDSRGGALDGPTAEQVLAHFTRLLESALRTPSAAISGLDMLGDAERADVLTRSRGISTAPVAGTLVDLLDDHADTDALALVADVAGAQTRVTYRELDTRSNRLARNLIAHGIGTEDLVGIRLAGSVEFVVAMLAVLKAGGAYLPIDPGYPAGRIEHLIADAKPRIVLDPTTLAAAESEARTESGHRVVDSDRVRPLTAGNLAYVMYTSGSTGTPKGVPVAHGAICDHVAGFGAQWDITSAARVLQISSVSFDASLLDLFVTLNHGATLVIPDARRIRDLSYLAESITRHRISVLHVVPSLLRALLALPESREWRDLTHVPVGGEALSGDVADRFSAVYEADLRNYYGPTEAVVSATHYSVRTTAGNRIVPIGQPNRNVTAYILDDRLQLVPDDIVGEIYLGGPQLARGYLDRPTMTAEHFVADPFNPGRRLYRTGDLASRNRQGDIEFVGRADQQVKIRGYRVELGEIAATLRAHPTVRDAVIVVDGQRDSGLLTAYLIADDTEINVDSVRAHAAKTLPEYMIPARYAVITAIPRSATGKLDKKALPHAPQVGIQGRRPPESPTQRRIAEIFADLLGVEAVAADESFFELGGHSLIASRLVNALRSEFGAAIQIRDLFEHPTVAGLATLVERAPATLRTRAAPELRRYGPAGRSPLAPIQRAAVSDGSHAQVRATLRFDGDLDATELQRALSEVAARHQILHMIRGEDADGAYQSPTVEPKVDFVSEHVTAGRLARALVEDEHRGFDLRDEVLWRARLFIDETTAVLAVTMHRSIADTWSLRIVVAELAAAYDRRMTAQPLPAEALAEIEFTDHVHWQLECVEMFAEDLLRLNVELARLPRPMVLNPDPEAGGEPTDSPDAVDFEVSPALRRRLRGLATADGASEFMLYQAMVAVALNILGAGDDIALAGSTSGRADVAVANMVGPLAGELVLRHDLAGAPTLRVALEQSRDAALGTYGTGDVPIEVITAEAVARLDARPRVQATVEVREQNWPSSMRFGPVLSAAVQTSRTGPDDGLRFEFIDADDGGFQVRVAAGDSNCDHAALERFAQSLRRVLEIFAVHPDHGVAELAEATTDLPEFSSRGHNDEID
ncbi:amino acid adenylation domain-containing protein [Gordonia sp. CPCC 205333]|uniref:amino acid adenylation domain-containing protein n=1 Tax=Gordonia sp. CPCC 205333 TaxID=3140790 RepID=UPI003AF3F22B